ncbi:glutamate decarboxylase [Nannochloropsis oceanica]
MASLDERLVDSSSSQTPPHPLNRQSTISQPSEVTYGYSYGYAYCARTMRKSIPKHELPDTPLPANVVKTLIDDEMILDGTPRMNLATFVTTYMEKECEELMMDAARKNYIDIDEYPQTYEIQKRCVNMLSRLWHAPLEPEEDATGTSTVGSSEAIMLAVLNMKWAWRKKRIAQGKPHDKPNLVCGSNVQVCWEKAMRYFEVEERLADVSPDCLVLTAERAKPLIDENTIGVCPILGSTFNGEFEDVQAIHDMLEALNAETGWDVPIHVDAASGGFIAPFINPDLVWDFRLPLVKSINASGHKFGLVYAGVGWLCFREKPALQQELTFTVDYLGGSQSSMTLNFSRGASQLVGQYYNFLRLGKEGYREVMTNAMENARYLREALLATGKVEIVDKEHMPLVAFALKPNLDILYTVFEIQDKLRERGWIIPAYRCSKGAEKLCIMRVVVKENFSRDLAELLVDDFQKAMAYLDKDHKAQQDLITKAREMGASQAHHMADIVETLRGRARRARNIFHDDAHRAEGKATKGVC